MEIRRATIEDLADIFTCNINAFKNYITLINRAPSPMMVDFSAELKIMIYLLLAKTMKFLVLH